MSTNSPAKRPSRYAETFDYDHRFHAGNAGDAFKHCMMRRWLQALQAASPDRAVHVVDTHAGAGMFSLGAQGEWLTGVGLVDAELKADLKGQSPETRPAHVPGPVWEFWQASGGARRHLPAALDSRPAGNRLSAKEKAKRGKVGGLYPGSPAFLRELLRGQDRLTLCELMEAPAQRVADFYNDDLSVDVRHGDGLEGAVAVAAEVATASAVAVFIDPPYVSKKEWFSLATGVQGILEAAPTAAVCIWYPIKSLTRPRGLQSTLRQQGLSGQALELVHTPLRLQRKRMNGSGLMMLNAPEGLVASLAPSCEWLGKTLATDGEWQMNVIGW